jgi:hypothetical protein
MRTKKVELGVEGFFTEFACSTKVAPAATPVARCVNTNEFAVFVPIVKPVIALPASFPSVALVVPSLPLIPVGATQAVTDATVQYSNLIDPIVCAPATLNVNL